MLWPVCILPDRNLSFPQTIYELSRLRADRMIPPKRDYMKKTRFFVRHPSTVCTDFQVQPSEVQQAIFQSKLFLQFGIEI